MTMKCLASRTVAGSTIVRMTLEDPEWVDVMGYENLPGCQRPGDAVLA